MKNNLSICLRQIKVQPVLHYKLKQYCKIKKQTLTAFYKEMIAWFIEQCSDDSELIYRASYKGGKNLSLWLEEGQAIAISQFARNASVSDARVIFTALVLYTQKLAFFNYYK
jgi:cytoplasmic iron level regulating protein YaaA (DUF328/UPF0246 family)